MQLLVADTCVLIDLERGGLLDAPFACGIAMAVPDLLYDRELADYTGPYLKSRGLGVLALTPTEASIAQALQTRRSTLSLPDCFALACATRSDHVLVTGDKNLRSEAHAQGVPVMGLLGMLDALATAGTGHPELHEGLTRISTHPRCRLPMAEVKLRLASWKPPT